MNKLAYGLLSCGVVGIIAVFAAPLSSGTGGSTVLWTLRKTDASSTYLPLLGFVVTAAMGGLAAHRRVLEKWMATAAASASCFALVMLATKKVYKAPGIGAKVLLATALAGLLVATIAATRSKP